MTRRHSNLLSAKDVTQWALADHSHNLSRQMLLRLHFVIWTYLAGILVTFLLLVSNLATGNIPLIIADAFLICAICVLIAIVHFTTHYAQAFRGSVTVFALMTAGIYISGELERAIILTPIILVLAYFLLGAQTGAKWTLAVITATIGLYGVAHSNGHAVHMPISNIITSLIIVTFVSVMLYVFGSTYEKSQNIVQQQAEALKLSNDKLRQELAKNIALAREMQQAMDRTEHNNKILEDSKKALMNVLEDTNELQLQLTEEKQGVEQKIIERTQELQQEQARLHASIDTLDLGFLMTLPDGTAIMHNNALISISGLKAPRHGKTPIDLLHDLAAAIGSEFDLESAVKQCQKTAKPFSVNVVQLGDKFIRILGSAILTSAYTEPLGVVVLVQDISEEKALDRSKDEFISIASHELRTPLTAIRGNISLLQLLHAETFKDTEVKEMMEDISNSVIRLIGIVNQFLTTSRLEQKRAVFQFSSVDVGAVIQHVAAELKPMADEAKLTVTLDIPDKLAKVKTDQDRLEGIFNNLLGNAIKYTPKGGVTITVEQSDKHIIVRVADTGKGIDPENQKLLFHKFQQASDNILTRDDSRSTGLGLYITKLMVDQMGAEIELESSEVGKGSVFRLTLPVA